MSQELSVCEMGSLPTTFTVTCTASASPSVLFWIVEGLNVVETRSILPGRTTGPFSYPTPTSNGNATLMVNDPTNVEVVEGTCFQCRDLVGNNTISAAVCVNVSRE